MILNLTDLSAEPLDRQISIQLARRMLSGELEAGAQLPSLTAMARRQHVNKSTVETAYTELARQGLLRLRSRRGPVVTDLPPEDRKAAAARLGASPHSILEALESLSGQLVSIVDKRKMCSVLLENLARHIQPESTVIALSREPHSCWSFLSNPGGTCEISIDCDDPLLEELRTAENPVQVSGNGDAAEPAGLRSKLRESGTRLIFPLRQGDDFLGLVALGNKVGDHAYSNDDRNLVTIFANQFATALAMANMYVGSLEKRKMEHELQAAKRIQANLLPKEIQDQDGIEIAAFTSPSSEVGGDFYDYFLIDPTHIGLVIADACGSGVPAAMLVSQIQAIVRSKVADGKSIEHTLRHLNRHLQSQAEAGFFATLFYGIVETVTGVLTYANAGHDFPILVRRNGQTEVLTSTGPALGVVPELDHKTGSIEIHEGDCLVLYTDGLTEATSASGKQYGEAQLKDMAIRCRHKPPDELLDFIRYDVERFSAAGLSEDDRTLMVVRINRFSASESYAA